MPSLVTSPSAANASKSSGSSLTKRSRYFARAKWMLAGSTWTYFPAEDRFAEILSFQPSRWSPTGEARIMPGLSIRGREVYEAPDWLWHRFLDYHPLAVLRIHSDFTEPYEAGGLKDTDAFALVGQSEPVR